MKSNSSYFKVNNKHLEEVNVLKPKSLLQLINEEEKDKDQLIINRKRAQRSSSLALKT